jgi:hypothetical protein
MITTFKDIKNKIIDVIATGLAVSEPTLNISYENVAPDFNSEEVDEWIRVSVQPNSRVRETNDNTSAIFENFGIIAIQVFTKTGQGTNREHEIIDHILDITTNYEYENLRIQQPTYTNDIISDGWKQTNINIDYEWDTYYTS